MIVDDRRVIVRVFIHILYNISHFCFSDGLGEPKRPQSKGVPSSWLPSVSCVLYSFVVFRVTGTLRSLWLSRTTTRYQVIWMVAPTVLVVSPRPLGASSSAVSASYKLSSHLTRATLYSIAEHLGLIPPQKVPSEKATLFMRPAPVPNEDETNLEEDARVADPLSDEMWNLLNTTARVNREVFTELFRPVPSNLVHSWAAYDVSVDPLHLDVLANLASCRYINRRSK